MLSLTKFVRKPFYVDAIRVTNENFEEVAQWCEGEIMIKDDESSPNNGKRFIKVKTLHPMTPRQTEAYVGDYILYASSNFKVYPTKSFEKSFEKVKTLTKAQADQAGIKVPHEPKPNKGPSPSDIRKKRNPTPSNPAVSPDEGEKLLAEILNS